VTRFGADNSAATAIEYALIAGLISIAIVAGLNSVRTQLSALFVSIATAMP
jgi:pilus assembly protein Flp/PilA